MSNEVAKGCHTCIWNDVPPLKTCERLQKESIFLYCPNWQKNELTGEVDKAESESQKGADR